jgi:hypothetical protein
MKYVFCFLYSFCLKHFLTLRTISRDVVINVKSLHAKYPLFLSDFNETWIFSTDFRKTSNIKFNQKPSSCSLVIPRDRTDATNLTVAFRNFANAPKKWQFVPHGYYLKNEKKKKPRLLIFGILRGISKCLFTFSTISHGTLNDVLQKHCSKPSRQDYTANCWWIIWTTDAWGNRNRVHLDPPGNDTIAWDSAQNKE